MMKKKKLSAAAIVSLAFLALVILASLLAPLSR